MSRLRVLEYPDPRLRTRARPVAIVDDGVRALLDDMLETMYAGPAIGLAATQVDVHLRLLVADVSDDQSAPLCFINPEVLSTSAPGMSEEQCLSLPGFSGVVARDLRVRVRALDRHGAPFELEAEGLLAVCIQHEIEHLDGRLFVDHLSWWKRLGLRRKLERARRSGGDGAGPVGPGGP